MYKRKFDIPNGTNLRRWPFLCIFTQDAAHLLDLGVHNAHGFVTGGHRAVLYSASPLLREAVLPWCTGVPAVDCLILPDFSETDIRNLFALLYDKGHRFCDIVKSMTSFSFARLPLCSVDVSSHSDLLKLKELICCMGTILIQFCFLTD